MSCIEVILPDKKEPLVVELCGAVSEVILTEKPQVEANIIFTGPRGRPGQDSNLPISPDPGNLIVNQNGLYASNFFFVLPTLP